jgi:hypothetical protein
MSAERRVSCGGLDVSFALGVFAGRRELGQFFSILWSDRKRLDDSGLAGIEHEHERGHDAWHKCDALSAQVRSWAKPLGIQVGYGGPIRLARAGIAGAYGRETMCGCSSQLYINHH